MSARKAHQHLCDIRPVPDNVPLAMDDEDKKEDEENFQGKEGDEEVQGTH